MLEMVGVVVEVLLEMVGLVVVVWSLCWRWWKRCLDVLAVGVVVVVVVPVKVMVVGVVLEA